MNIEVSKNSPLEAMELKANLNPEQRAYLEVLKDKMKKILGNKTKQELAKAGDLVSLNKYKDSLQEILDFLRTKEFKGFNDLELQNKAMDYIEKLKAEGVTIESARELLAGIDLDRAWKIRKGWLRDHHEASVLYSLAGLDSPKVWKIRDDIYNNERHMIHYSAYLAVSLTGLDSERAWKMRDGLITKNLHKNFVFRSIAGLDSERAWKMRNDALASNTDMLELASSLTGLDSERAWVMRRRIIPHKDIKDSEKEDLRKKGVAGILLYGLAGIDTPEAWKFRAMIADIWSNSEVEAKSLAYIDSPRAWDIRENFVKNHHLYNTVAIGLAGLDTEQAWKMREELRHLGASKINIAQGIYGGWLMVAVRKARRDRGEWK